MDTYFPCNGAIISLQNRSFYLKCSPNLGVNMQTASQVQDWEMFVAQSLGQHKFAMKHKQSDLYVGLNVDDGSKPQLAKERHQYQELTFEARDGFIGIKSCRNTYLCCQRDNQVVWRTRPSTHNSDIWKIDFLLGQKSLVKNETKGLSTLPMAGQKLGLFAKGKYVGLSKQNYRPIGLAPALNENQVFVVETNGSVFALKQEVSGLYLGGNCSDGHHPILTQTRTPWQEFVIQIQVNGIFRIRSNFRNTFLCCSGSNLKWVENPEFNQQLWVLVPTQWSITRLQMSPPVVQVGVQIAIRNKYGLIGKRRGLHQKLGLVEKLDTFEVFTATKGEGSSIAFRQMASGYYIGGRIDLGQRPLLAPCQNVYENYQVENKGNSQISIKSIHNTYLCCRNKKPTWKQDLDQSGIWTVQVLNQDPSSIFPSFPKASGVITLSISQSQRLNNQ